MTRKKEKAVIRSRAGGKQKRNKTKMNKNTHSETLVLGKINAEKKIKKFQNCSVI